MNKRNAQAMLLTTLAIGGTLLGATTIAGLLLVYQIRQATDLSNSAKAIYAADAGIEWGLYKYFTDPSVAPIGTLSNRAGVSVTCYNSSTPAVAVDCGSDAMYKIQAKGNVGGVSRAFELEF
jgi:hypothetical protein